MKFTTMNSTYELHETEQKIRRLRGTNEPLLEQGSDGEWKEYREIVVNGGRVSIFFEDGSWVITSPIQDYDGDLLG
jgi:hypothetical protein